jgi:hypothetical protein
MADEGEGFFDFEGAPWTMAKRAKVAAEHSRKIQEQGGTPVQQAVNKWYAEGGANRPIDPNRNPNEKLLSHVNLEQNVTLPQGAKPWLEDVYRDVPGGLLRALDEAGKWRRPGEYADLKDAGYNYKYLYEQARGLRPPPRATMEKLSRPVEIQDTYLSKDRGGQTFLKRNPIVTNLKGPDKEAIADVLAHELTHVTHGFGDSPVMYVDETVKAYPNMSESVQDWIRYAISREEVEARFLRPIKHWGAVRGILPTSAEEAKKLIDMYYKENQPDKGPVAPLSEVEKKPGQTLTPFLWKDLKNDPRTPYNLLRTVKSSDQQSPNMQQIARQRLSEMKKKT